jgi:condensin complex subunit 1
MIEVIFLLIKFLSTEEEQSESEEDVSGKTKQIQNFFELLFERFLDVNAYVRPKVISTCIRLLE